MKIELQEWEIREAVNNWLRSKNILIQQPYDQIKFTSRFNWHELVRVIKAVIII